MNPFLLLVIRILLAAGIAILISRYFFKGTPVVKVALLALVLLGLAYLHEYFRKKKERENNE